MYFNALTAWLADFDPQPPQLRRHIEQEYFSQREVANRLGVTARTVKRWSDKGAFPGYPLWNGRRKLYKWADVEAFLKQNKTGDDRR